MINCNFDVVVIGAGPAGLAASVSANKQGAKTLLIERERLLGGILKQCVHDGFGVTRFNEKLTGPEYAEREIAKLNQTDVTVWTLTYVTRIEKNDDNYFCVHVVNREGVGCVHCNKLILATGCRERTSKQIGVHGTNPAGVMTAGVAQHYINLMGKMPAKKCVILGSGDIGLIMARRLTLEGAQVVGVYEAKSTPSGLTRNIVQCLNDFNIPLHLSHTVTRVYGVDRLEAVEIAQVDERMRPIKGTEQRIECDSLILSVGLIPENEVAKQIDVPLSPATKGPVVDQFFMTMVDNVYSCGNAMHVNDLADYVSESGEIAGCDSACEQSQPRRLADVISNDKMAYIVPQKINLNADLSKCIFYFRSRGEYGKCTLTVKCGDKVLAVKKFNKVRPPEMERIPLNLSGIEGNVSFDLEVE